MFKIEMTRDEQRVVDGLKGLGWNVFCTSHGWDLRHGANGSSQTFARLDDLIASGRELVAYDSASIAK